MRLWLKQKLIDFLSLPEHVVISWMGHSHCCLKIPNPYTWMHLLHLWEIVSEHDCFTLVFVMWAFRQNGQFDEVSINFRSNELGWDAAGIRKLNLVAITGWHASFRYLKCKVRAPDKSGYRKTIFVISHQKHMLLVLKRTVSMRRFFWAPKTRLNCWVRT